MAKIHLPLVTRRDVLVWLGATSAGSALVLGCSSPAAKPGATASAPTPQAPPAPPPAPYFTAEDRSILGALADAVIPPDDAPGGNDLGAVDYIENLLTAFDGDGAPLIFSGGPYSGRQPTPNADGTASSSFPSDGFAVFLPLDRVADRAWRLRIYGSAGVPGGGPNDAITGPVIGLRDAVSSAIAQAKKAAPAGVAWDALSASQQAALLAAIDATTQSTLIELVLEGSFTNPEYGGNKGMAGWAMTYFEGDSLPYGYSSYDATTGAYIDHPDAPCASANPGPDPMPMDAATELLVSLAFTSLGGVTFS